METRREEKGSWKGRAERGEKNNKKKEGRGQKSKKFKEIRGELRE